VYDSGDLIMGEYRREREMVVVEKRAESVCDAMEER
jgi:hypothetical protein